MRHNKLVLLGIGFIVSYMLGFIIPGIWLWFILYLLVVLMLPSAASTVASAQTEEVPSSQYDAGLERLEMFVQSKLLAANNDTAKNDMADILAMVQSMRIDNVAMPVDASRPASETSAPVSISAQTPTVSAADLADAAEKREQHNINTMLYVASFLLVGASALFIGGTLDPTAKVIGLMVVALSFYIAGIALYTRVARLRPAALAFTGTGLAMVPFVGLAFYTFVLQDGSLTWWVTSIIGLAMFLYATFVIKHQLLTYMSLAFVFSLTTSSVAMLSVAFVWYLVAVIVTGSIMAYLGYVRPRWLPSDFAKPLADSGQLAAPIAIIGSLFVSDRLQAIDYELLFGVTSLQYAVAALGLDSRLKRLHWTLARVFAILMALVATYDLADSWQAVAGMLAATAVVTHVYAIAHHDDAYEIGWLAYAQVAMTVGSIALAPDWSNVALCLAALVLMSGWQTARMKRIGYGLMGIIAALALPFVTVFGVVHIDHQYELTALILMLLTWVFFIARYVYRQSDPAYVQLLSIGYVAYIFAAAICAFMTHDPLWVGTYLTLMAVVFYLGAFIEKAASLHIVSNVALAIGVGYFFSSSQLDSAWWPLATTWVCAPLWYALRWYFVRTNDQARQNSMTVSTLAILLLGALVSAAGDTVVAACLTGCVAAGIMVYEGFVRHDHAYYELAIGVASLALQRLIGHVYPLTDTLVYTHWWAMSIMWMAVIRLQYGDESAARTRGYIALGLLSVPTGLSALRDPDTYQFLFLIEHLALLVGGFVMNKQLIVRWAAVCIGLAVIWLLQGYTYILLSLLGLSLIGLAVWKLNKKS